MSDRLQGFGAKRMRIALFLSSQGIKFNIPHQSVDIRSLIGILEAQVRGADLLISDQRVLEYLSTYKITGAPLNLIDKK